MRLPRLQRIGLGYIRARSKRLQPSAKFCAEVPLPTKGSMRTLEQKRKAQRDRRGKLRAKGLCRQCGRMKTKFSLCRFCMDELKKAPSYGCGTSSECKREWRARRRALELCMDCGEKSGKFSRCKVCRDAVNGAAKLRRKNVPRFAEGWTEKDMKREMLPPQPRRQTK